MKLTLTILLSLLALWVYKAEAALAQATEDLQTLQLSHRFKDIQVIKLQTQIVELKTDHQHLLAGLISCQVAEDRQGFDWPNSLLPELPR